MAADLRPARPEDAADVVRVLRASRLRFLPYAPPAHSEAEDLRWARAALLPSGGVTVATVDERIVGVLATRRADDASWIDQLYVQPEYCGRGVGSQLMQAALSYLRRPVRLYTFQENREASRFYERFEFVAIKWGDGSENEEGCPDVLYELALPMALDDKAAAGRRSDK
jgi:GNAT superfamily N-acetyltransferase